MTTGADAGAHPDGPTRARGAHPWPRAHLPGEGNDVAALSGVDLTSPPARWSACSALPASGKSTLLTLFAGLLRPSAGRWWSASYEIARMNERGLDTLHADRRRRGAAGRDPQPAAVRHRARERALRPAPRRGSPPTRTGCCPSRRVLDLVGLADEAHAARALTPGQRQRLALAVGLARGPGPAAADEPTSQLDHEGRDEVLAAVTEINRDLGTTVVVVTHDPEVARPAAAHRDDPRRPGRRRGPLAARTTPWSPRDGSLTLPPDLLERLPPGSLLRLVHEDGESASASRGTPRSVLELESARCGTADWSPSRRCR